MSATKAFLIAVTAAIVLTACGGGDDNSSGSASNPQGPSAPSGGGSGPSAPGMPSGSRLSLAAQVGQMVFFDQSLSGSGKMSCATCHDPGHAYGPPNDLAVQLGGTNLMVQGHRAVPSLRYKSVVPPFADLLDNPDGISVPGPGGGFTWDGRAPNQAEQAKIPLLSPFEMANASSADVVKKVQAASYVALVKQAFGDNVFADPDTAFNDIASSLQAYQQEDESFNPFSSKYDLYAGNKIGGTLTAAETRGMSVFTDVNRGNCAACHYQGAGLNGSIALFTDFSFEAISVPRNSTIALNNDPTFYDLGVCGPDRTDHLPDSPGTPLNECGMFKTPTLRNVATRTTFFHNGIFHSLEQAIRWYNTRDSNPELWYPTLGGKAKTANDPSFPTYGLIKTQYEGGTVQKFNDIPAKFVGNIDTQGPLDGRPAGSKPPMSEQDIADLLCFLNTLNDDYKVPTNPPTSGKCVD
jgi:cytochrome c peroxidase